MAGCCGRNCGVCCGYVYVDIVAIMDAVVIILWLL